jgi:uncharacterized membrane protein
MSSYVFTNLDDPLGTRGTKANGINGAGQIVGTYFDDKSTAHGFLDSGGSYTTLDDPSGIATDAQGITGAGQIVGSIRPKLNRLGRV